MNLPRDADDGYAEFDPREYWIFAGIALGVILAIAVLIVCGVWAVLG